MKSSRNKLLGLVILLLFLLPLGLALKKVDQEIRREAWNHALIAAIKKNNTAEVTDLLSEGADPNAKDIAPDTRSLWRRLWDRLKGEHATIGNAHTALLVALETNDTSTSPLFRPENVPLTKVLLDKGAIINVADEDRVTPLILAVMDTKRETAKLLLERGANVNAMDREGSTALHFAAHHRDSALVQLLLTHGAFVNASNNAHDTPLHEGAFFGRINTVRLLVENGGKIDARDTDGDTPLENAVQADAADVVRFLLVSGALVNTRDNKGRSPLQVAKRHKKTEIITILKKAGAKE